MRSQGSGRQRDGAVVVLVGLSLIALLAMVGLAIDGGYVYVVRQKSQMAADAAALAAALNIPTPTPTAPTAKMSQEATLVANLNNMGGLPAEISLVYPYNGDSNRVQAVNTCTYQPMFLGLVGVGQFTITDRAVAQYTPTGTSSGGGSSGSGGSALDVFRMTMFTENTTATSLFSGVSLSTSGTLHFNGNLTVTGGSFSASPRPGVAGTFTGSGSFSSVSVKTPPEVDSAGSLAAAKAAGNAFRFVSGTGWQRFNPSTGAYAAFTSATGITTSGSQISMSSVSSGATYVEGGSVRYTGSTKNRTGFLVADGPITVTGSPQNDASFTYSFVSLSTANPAIDFPAGSQSPQGFIFWAPDGTIRATNQSGSLHGSLVAKNINVTGGSWSIENLGSVNGAGIPFLNVAATPAVFRLTE